MPFGRFFRFFRYVTFGTLKTTVSRAFQRRLLGLSAEMAYNTTLAIFPALIAILTAIGLFESTVRETLTDLARPLQNVAPQQVWELLNEFVESIKESSSRSLLSISFLAAIWISSAALSAAMNALDQIHRIPREQRRPFWKAKIVSIVLTLGTMLLLVVASFLVLISDFIVQFVVDHFLAYVIDAVWVDWILTVWRLLSWPFALATVAAAFALVYRFGPSQKTPGVPIVPGAVMAAVSWAGISALFRLYVANFGRYNQIYGAVGTVIVLMLWFYMSSLVLLLGDQLNATVSEQMPERDKRALGLIPTSPRTGLKTLSNAVTDRLPRNRGKRRPNADGDPEEREGNSLEDD